ncbi:hypothetical protein DFQ30_000180 [Apophysomyces sp. BC1015]|nr:hypothetical protein DFQ30_000180 [Apophysomyces sp. BC1015]
MYGTAAIGINYKRYRLPARRNWLGGKRIFKPGMATPSFNSRRPRPYTSMREARDGELTVKTNGSAAYRPIKRHNTTSIGRNFEPENRQHDFYGLPQQTQRYSISTFESVGDRDLDNLPTTLRIPQDICEELLVYQRRHFRSNSEPLRNTQHRPLCRPENSTTPEVCLLEARPDSSSHRCIHLSWSTFRHQLIHPPWNLISRFPEQDTSRPSASNCDYALLAQRTVVTTTSRTLPSASSTSQPVSLNLNSNPTDSVAIQEQPMESHRMAGLRKRYEEMEGLSDTAREILIDHHTNDSPTNRTHRKGQQLFIQWAILREIDVCNFTRTNLINFLVAASHNGYSLNTLKLYKTAILKFHQNPQQFYQDTDVLTLL